MAANWSGTGRRGRPRSDRPATDLGTPEQQARRAGLAGGGDPALTEYPLGLLLLRRLIGGEEHEAGCYYAFLYGRSIAATQLTTNRLYHQLAMYADGRDLSDEMQAHVESLYRKGKNRLLAAGRRICDATENIVVFGRTPRFLLVDARRPVSAWRADAGELAAVQAGLATLAACYGRSAGRLGRMEDHKSPSMAVRPRDTISVDRNRKRYLVSQ